MKLKLGLGFKIFVVISLLSLIVAFSNLFMYAGRTPEMQGYAMLFYDQLGRYSAGIAAISTVIAITLFIVATKRALKSEN